MNRRSVVTFSAVVQVLPSDAVVLSDDEVRACFYGTEELDALLRESVNEIKSRRRQRSSSSSEAHRSNNEDENDELTIMTLGLEHILDPSEMKERVLRRDSVIRAVLQSQKKKPQTVPSFFHEEAPAAANEEELRCLVEQRATVARGVLSRLAALHATSAQQIISSSSSSSSTILDQQPQEPLPQVSNLSILEYALQVVDSSSPVGVQNQVRNNSRKRIRTAQQHLPPSAIAARGSLDMMWRRMAPSSSSLERTPIANSVGRSHTATGCHKLL